MILEVIAFFTSLAYSVKSIFLLLVLRTISGVVAGLGTAIVPIALTEMFPSNLSGFGSFFQYLCVSSFILIGMFANPICGSGDDKESRSICLANNWRLLLTWPAALSVLRLILLAYAFKLGSLESPGYYLNKLKGVELKQALNKWFSTVYPPRFVIRKVNKVIKDSEEIKSKQEPGLSSMFSKMYGFRFFVVCMLNTLQQFSGINFLIFFSTTLFDQLSGNGATMSLLIGAANVSGALVGMFSIRRYGRRFNLVIGCLLQAFSFATLGMGNFSLSNFFLGISIGSKIIPAISAVMFTLSFAVGYGGTMPLYCAEIIPSIGVGLGCGLRWVGAAIIGKYVPLVLKIIGPLGMIMFFIVCNVISFFFIDFACPETKGLSEKDIEDIFGGKKSKWIFLNFF